jgi:tRNA-specific 2-thiouridylase
MLFKSKITVDDLTFTSGQIPESPFECQVKIRCAARPADALVAIDGNKAIIEFKSPQRAAAPGQTAVFYKDDILLGGGTICNL